jgi:hypothetical protein
MFRYRYLTGARVADDVDPFDFAPRLRPAVAGLRRGKQDKPYKSIVDLRWTQTLFTIPSANMIMRANEPL